MLILEQNQRAIEGRRSSSTLKSERGVTLVELMISTAILVTVLGGCLFLLTQARYVSGDARMKVLALGAAKSTLEAVKITALAGVTAINTAQYVPADLPNGTITIQTNPANLANVAIATVTVTVQWQGSKNILKNLSISTMRSRY